MDGSRLGSRWRVGAAVRRGGRRGRRGNRSVADRRRLGSGPHGWTGTHGQPGADRPADPAGRLVGRLRRRVRRADRQRRRGDDNTWFPNNCSLRGNCAGFNDNELEVMNPSGVSAARRRPEADLHVHGGRAVAGSQALRVRHAARPSRRAAGLLVLPVVAGQRADAGLPGRRQAARATPARPIRPGGATGRRGTTPRPTSSRPTAPAPRTPAAGGPTRCTRRGSRRRCVRGTKVGFATDPSQAFHTYTFELKPNNTYSVWIDGEPQPWATDVGPVKPDLAAKDSLVLSYALRTCPCKTRLHRAARASSTSDPCRSTRTRPHDGVGVDNRGIAPGTTFG